MYPWLAPVRSVCAKGNAGFNGWRVQALAPVKLRNNAARCAATAAGRKESKIVKATHLCCDIVKQIRLMLTMSDVDHEVTMPALAATRPAGTARPSPRGSVRPRCPVCADSMIAAEASAFLTDDVVSYLWTCDTCGYGFVTKHSFKAPVCN
jgi:hypothetical protein